MEQNEVETQASTERQTSVEQQTSPAAQPPAEPAEDAKPARTRTFGPIMIFHRPKEGEPWREWTGERPDFDELVDAEKWIGETCDEGHWMAIRGRKPVIIQLQKPTTPIRQVSRG